MKKLSEFFKKIWEKFKSFSKAIKIAIIVAIIAVLAAIISLIVYSTSTKYATLYSNLDTNDVDVVIKQLEDSKIDKKVEGNSILVPEDKVDELRLQLASKLTDGSKGYELMDDSSSFGMTDEEFNIKKVRMIEGELEKTIKTIEQIESVKVHINQSESSVFVKEQKEGSASVVVKLKTGKTLDDSQVESIMSIVSASTDGIPKENVEVVDTKANNLSKNINSESSETGVNAETIAKQQTLQKNKAKDYEDAIVSLLEPIVGKNKVSASVNVDMDFDAQQTEEIVMDPNKVIISQDTINSWNNDNGNATTESPVDNNMSNTIEDNTNQNGTSGSNEQKTNYDTGKTTTKTIASPGKTKRLTASVFIDGNLDAATQEDFQTAVANAIGVDESRGDSISLTGVNFDTEAKDQQQAQIDELTAQEKTADRNKLILWCVLGVAVLAGIIALIVVLVKRRKKNADNEEQLLDVVINDKIPGEETTQFEPINFEPDNEKSHIEKEIKDYAKEKPEQVVDIIKSWLADNER